MNNKMKLSHYNSIMKIDSNKHFICNAKAGTYEIIDDELREMLIEGSKINQLDEQIVDNLFNKRILIDSEFDSNQDKYTPLLPLAFIIPTYDCNLKCSYCFQTKADNSKSELAIDLKRIFQVIENNKCSTEPVFLFGGEPLLNKNMLLMRTFLSMIRKRNWKFSMFTNGIGINLYLELFKKYKDYCDHIHVTIDGNEDAHNCRRGKNTYKIIMANVKELLNSGISVKIRVNVDSETVDGLNEFLDDCSVFSTNGLLNIYVAGIRESLFNTFVDKSNFVTNKTRNILLDLKKSYDFQLKNFIGLEFGKNVLNGELLEVRDYFCRKKIMIDYDGYCYPCISTAAFHEFAVSRIDFESGEVYVRCKKDI